MKRILNSNIMLETFYGLLGFNKCLFVAINHLSNFSALPHILQIISHIFLISNFAVCYILVCLYFYYRTLKEKYKTEYFMPIYYELVRIGICYTLFGLTFAALKFSFNLPRPFCSLLPSEFITIADVTIERCLSSFPSAHTGLSILVSYCLWKYMGNNLKILSCLTIFLVAISRITLAMHYPMDIIYSALITALVILLSNYIYYILKHSLIKVIGKLILTFIFRVKS